MQATKEKKPKKPVRPYTFGEEIANATTHGPFATIMLFLLPFAAVYSYAKYGVLAAVSNSIFCIALFMMFLASTLYHCMKQESRHKDIFQILDHICIYIAIAGTYTPISLVVIGGWQGWVIFGLQWAMVIFGILYKSLMRKSIPAASLTIYLIMGWTIIFFFPLFVKRSHPILIALISLGGIFYSAGAYFYSKKDKKFFHMIWHLFINFAACAQFIAIVFFLQ